MGGQLSILTRMAGKLLSSTYGANAECNFIYKKSKKDVARVRAKVALVVHVAVPGGPLICFCKKVYVFVKKYMFL